MKIRLFIIINVLVVLVAAIYATVIFDTVNKFRIGKSKEIALQGQNTQDKSKKLIFFQEAALLYPSEDNILSAGIAALDINQYKLSELYFKRIKTKEGLELLGDSLFNRNELNLALKTYEKAYAKGKNDNISLKIARTFFKSEKFVEAKAILEKLNNEDTKELLSIIQIVSGEIKDFNSINRVYLWLLDNNYPQVASGFIRSKYSPLVLNRDGYLLLAEDYLSSNETQKSYDSLLNALEQDRYYPQTYQQLISLSNKLNNTSNIDSFEKYLNLITW